MSTPTVPSSSAVKPARSAASGFTEKRTAGPLVVFSMPSSISTIGVLAPTFTLPSASATRGAHVLNRSGSGENSLTTTGSGAPVRSPIISWSTWMNSTSRPGSEDATLARTSLITSSTPRLRLAFSFTAMSPVFGSVTAASPSSSPVRRDVLSTSGVSRRMRSMWPRTRLVSCSELPGGIT